LADRYPSPAAVLEREGLEGLESAGAADQRERSAREDKSLSVFVRVFPWRPILRPDL